MIDYYSLLLLFQHINVFAQTMHLFQGDIDPIDDLWTVFHGGSDFAIKTSPSGTTEAENSAFSKVCRNIIRIDVPFTVLHGESEFEVKMIEFLVPRAENQDFSIFAFFQFF